MNLSDSILIFCAEAASDTSPLGQNPERDGYVNRSKQRKGGPDKGGVQSAVTEDGRDFIEETNPQLFAKKKKSLRGTSGGQSEGSSLTTRNYKVVDGMGRVLHEFRTKEEAEQASAGNRYTRVITQIPDSDTPEVRDMIRTRLADTQVRVFRRSVPFPNPLPGSPQGR